jgi:hypothetical protein
MGAQEAPPCLGSRGLCLFLRKEPPVDLAVDLGELVAVEFDVAAGLDVCACKPA